MFLNEFSDSVAGRGREEEGCGRQDSWYVKSTIYKICIYMHSHDVLSKVGGGGGAGMSWPPDKRQTDWKLEDTYFLFWYW